MILDRYQPNFAALSREQTTYLRRAVENTMEHPPLPGPPVTGEELMSVCSLMGYDQADVVMSLARDATPVGVDVIETIVGRPIVRAAPRRARVRRGPAPRVRRSDNRTIVAVVANPKKPGSKSHERFKLYKVGETVDDYIAAGGSMADIRWDLARSFIVLE